MRNVLRLSIQKDPLTLDPQKSGERFSSALIFLLFKGLTRFAPDHSITCDLAKSFDVLDNDTRYVFHLGEHFWSDGTPITAHDFVYSWRRALHPDFPLKATNLFYYLKNAVKAKKGLVPMDKVGVWAKDDLTLEVELEYSCPYFLELTSFCALFPVSSRVGQDRITSVFSGPFQLQHWHQGQEILLKKRASCSNAASVRVDGIRFSVIPDAKKAFALFESDQLDWIGEPISPIPANFLPALLQTKQIKPIAGLTGCWFNTTSHPFNNVNLRRSFAMAIPREQLLERLLLPKALSARRLCPPILQESEAVLSIQECPRAARALFQLAQEELKIKRLKVVLSYEATDEFSRLAVLLKGYWEEMFNVSIQLEPLPFRAFCQRLLRQQFQMSLFGSLSQYTDVINFLERFEFGDIPRNFSGWENTDYKNLLQRYRKTAAYKQRQELARKAETLLLNEVPVAPIYRYQCIYLQKSHVKNLCITPVGDIQFDRVILTKRQQSSAQEMDSSLETVEVFSVSR